MTASLVVGGVGELYQGDLDVGRHVVERLRDEGVPNDIIVEDFHYGAVAVAQRLEELAPASLILVGAVCHQGAAGMVTRRLIQAQSPPPDEAQAAVADAVTGYVSLGLLVDVLAALGRLPAATIAVEIEAAITQPSPQLSPPVAAAVGPTVALIRRDIDAHRTAQAVSNLPSA